MSINKTRRSNKLICFEEYFDKTLKKKLEDYLDSDKPIANVSKALLMFAAAGGMLGIGIAAPNIFKALAISRESGRKTRLSNEGFNRLRRSYYELRKRKYIESISREENVSYKITDLGLNILNQFLMRKVSIKKPVHWDGKWRLILFDIPVILNKSRDSFRRHLMEIGCYKLQKSVWIYPFPCADSVYEITRLLNITKYVDVYTIVDYDNQSVLKHFRSLLK